MTQQKSKNSATTTEFDLNELSYKDVQEAVMAARMASALAPDWQLLVDVGRQMKLPDYITQMTLHPGLAIFSNTTKQVIMREVFLPW